MKQFNSGASRSMRARHARVSSTEEISLAASAPTVCETSTRARYSITFHEIEAVLDRGSDGLIKRALVRLAHFVGPQALHRIDRIRHRLDAPRVDRAHLLDQAEHAVQPLEYRRLFAGSDGDARQTRRKPSHVVGG